MRYTAVSTTYRQKKVDTEHEVHSSEHNIQTKASGHRA